jgi:hypothetical protein
MLHYVMVKKNSESQSIKSIRLPDKIWNLLKRTSARRYRTMNSQILMIIEDWLVEHGYIEEVDRTRTE